MTAPVYTRAQIAKAVGTAIYVAFLLGVGVWLYQQQATDNCQRKRNDILELRDQLWARGATQDVQAYYWQIITENPLPNC